MVSYIGRSADQIGATSLVLSPDSIKANTALIYDTIFANGTYTFSSLSGWIPGTEISTLHLMGAGGDGYHGGTAGPSPREGGGGGGGAMAIKRVAKTGGLDSVSFTVTLPAGGSQLGATLTCPEFGVSLTAGAGYNAGPGSPAGSNRAGPGGTATGGDLNHSGGDGKPQGGGGGGAGGRWGPGGDGSVGPNGGGGGFGGAPGFTGGTASPNPGWGGGGGSISGGVKHTPTNLTDENSGPATGAGGLRKEASYVGQPYTTRASYGDFNFPGPGGAGAPAPAAGQPGGYGGGGGGGGKSNPARKGGDGGFGGGGGAFGGVAPDPIGATTLSAGNGGHGGGGGGGQGSGPGPGSGQFNSPTIKLGALGGNSALIVLFG